MDAITEALHWAFAEAYHRDHANSAIHCADVQYRPLTVRLAYALLSNADSTGDVVMARKMNEVLTQAGTNQHG